MKKIIFSTLIASLLAFVGCQNEELVNENTNNGGEKVILTANIQGATNSRVVLTPDTENGDPIVKVAWNESEETFEVYGSSVASSTFTQIAGTNQFVGTLPESANGEYEAYYGDPSSLVEQDGKLGQSTADDSPVLMSAEFNSSSPSITFEHVTAILKPTFKVNGTDINNTITKIVMGDVVFALGGTPEYRKITIAPTSPATTLADVIYIHLPIMRDYTGDTFTFTVTAGGKEYTGSLTIPTDMSIEAGNLYTATIALTEVPVINYVWTSGIVASASVEGDGTEESPYLIHSANDLQWMIDQVKNAAPMPGAIDDDENSTPQIPYYLLTHNLEIDSEEGATWTPIGTSSSPFVGYFDGGGHTISGEMVTASDVVDAGFFGYVGVGTVITNLTNAANVTSLAQGLDVCHVGGIVGRAMGFGKVYCQMNSTYIIACHNTGTITNGTGMTSYSATGGIAGFIYGGTCVLACSNTGDLADNDLSNSVLVGGVVGLGIIDYDTTPSIVSCWTGKGAILGDGVVIQRANYSTDSNCFDEEFYTESFTDELLNEELNFWIYMFNYINYDYTYDMEFEERDINCNWHWELENGSVVLKPGAPEYI